MDFHFDIKDSKFDHGSSVVKNIQIGGAETHDGAILRELEEIRDKLAATEPLVAESVAKLEQAVRENNKPKISTIIQQLSTGFAATVLANLASPALLAFLGIR